MYDAVEVENIPNGPHAVAGYVNGNFVTVPELRKRFPHARILEISVGGDVPAHCYDVERGDYHADECARLFKIAKEAGIWRPCFYADLSTMPAVKASLAEVVTSQEEVRLWVAAWDGVSIVPHGYDAKQFTDKALGRSLDESILRDDFFGPVKPAPRDQALRAVVTVDPDSNTWTVEHENPTEVKP
jgi:hypothetical protein